MSIPSSGVNYNEPKPESSKTSAGEIIPSTEPTQQKKTVLSRVLHSFRERKSDVPKLSNELSGTHLQMIAIGGSIGTGLFIGSGVALSQGGPASLLLCWLLTGTMIYCVIQALGELSVTINVTGAFIKYTSKLIDPSWGFAMGWNYAFSWMIMLPLELSGATLTLKYWPGLYNSIPSALFITFFYGIIIILNSLSVKYYGMSETIFSSAKIVVLSLFILFGIFVICAKVDGQEYAKFGNYWNDPGTFANGFKGVISVFVLAAFSFSGTELVGLTSAESKQPEKEIPKAIKSVFLKIIIFYISTLLIIGILVPYNHAGLIQQRNIGAESVDASPFVLALQSVAGLEILPSAMNCLILVSILSVANSSIYAASRTLMGLSQNSQAPRFLQYIDKKGRPLAATGVTLSFGIIAYISCMSERGSEILFTWLVSFAGYSGLITWASICICHIRFRSALRRAEKPLEDLRFSSQVGLAGSWYGLIFVLIVLIAQFYISVSPIGGKFSLTGYIQNTLALTFIFLLYLAHKIYTYIETGKLSFLIAISDMGLEDCTFAPINSIELTTQPTRTKSIFSFAAQTV